MPNIKDDEKRVMVKIAGLLVGMLVEIYSVLYVPLVVYENGRKLLFCPISM